jgi:HTH-type transcriptional regulator/antitoxin HigA
MIKNPAKKSELEVSGWESPVAIHPGLYLQDYLEEFPMSKQELAKRIDLTPKTINEIIKGRANITNLTALKLSKVFPLSEGYWNNLQEIFFSDIARIEETKKIESEIAEHLPKYRETYKVLTDCNFVEKFDWREKNFAHIVRGLHKYFGANSLLFPEQEFNVGTAFRTYSKKNINPLTVAAWVRAGEIKASKTKVEPFDLQKLKVSISKIRSLATQKSSEYLPEIEKILAECGVVVVYMPLFKNSYAQGAVRWMSKDKVVLMLNTSKKSEDKFWFNLFHELGHIVKHSKINKDNKTKMYLDLDDAPNNEIEKEANEYAQKQLIPDFEARCDELFSTYKNDIRRGIVQISKELELPPAIFAGRIAYHFNEQGNNVYPILSEFWKDTSISHTNVLS